MCYSPKSSAGTWLLHFNSLLAKLTIYYCMCWLRSEKMNWLLIRVALRGHRGETTHSFAISVNGAPSDWANQGRDRSWKLNIQPPPCDQGEDLGCARPPRVQSQPNMVQRSPGRLPTNLTGLACVAAETQSGLLRLRPPASLTNRSRAEDFELESYEGNIGWGRDDLWVMLLFGSLFQRSFWISPFITINQGGL